MDGNAGRNLPARPDRLVLSLVVTVALVLFATRWCQRGVSDYTFFQQVFHNLVHRDGYELYRYGTNIQSGPVAILTVGLLSQLGGHSFDLAVMALCGGCLWMVGTLPGARSRPTWFLAIGSCVVVWRWRDLSTIGHIDDAMVLTVVVGCVALVRRGRRETAALIVGIALAIKPWMIMFVLMSARPVGSVRDRLRLPALSIVVGALLWSPFIIGSLSTLGSVRPTVEVARDSVLHFVVGTGAPMPTAARVFQLVLGTALVGWLVHRDRLASCMLAGVAVRILLDAATWPYYTAGFVLGAYLWDTESSRWRFPVASVLAAALLVPASILPWDEVRSVMRLVACVGAIALALWGPAEVGSRDDEAAAARGESGSRRAEEPEQNDARKLGQVGV